MHNIVHAWHIDPNQAVTCIVEEYIFASIESIKRLIILRDGDLDC